MNVLSRKLIIDEYNDPLLGGLVGWWAFDSGSLQNRSGFDLGMSSNVGTVQAAPFFPGFEPAISFLGTGGVLMPKVASLWTDRTHLTGAVSCSYWVKTSSSNWMVAANAQAGGSYAVYVFGGGVATAGKPQIWNNSAGPNLTATITVNDDKPHHIVCTRSGSTGSWSLKIYIDRALNNSTVSAVNPVPHVDDQLGLGRFGGYNGYQSVFSAYDIRIYNRELSHADVIDLYNYPFKFRNLFRSTTLVRPPTWQLRVSKNGGAYTAITPTSSPVRAADASISADKATITVPRL